MKKKIIILIAVLFGLSLQEANTQKENANNNDMILAANNVNSHNLNDFATVNREAKEAGVLQSNWRTMLQGAITTNPSNSWDNGSRYKGQNRSNGAGAYYWNDDEDMYFGSFKDNEMDGYGIYIAGGTRTFANCPDCKYYAGYWSNAKASGVGACYDTNGKLIYYGNFRDGKPTGAYPISGTGYSSYKFEIMDFNDVNAKYIGETYNGRRHGFGIFVWSNGNVFFGWWKDGARDGDGIVIANNGNITTGSWQVDTHNPTLAGTVPFAKNSSSSSNSSLAQNNSGNSGGSSSDEFDDDVIDGFLIKMFDNIEKAAELTAKNPPPELPCCGLYFHNALDYDIIEVRVKRNGTSAWSSNLLQSGQVIGGRTGWISGLGLGNYTRVQGPSDMKNNSYDIRVVDRNRQTYTRFDEKTGIAGLIALSISKDGWRQEGWQR